MIQPRLLVRYAILYVLFAINTVETLNSKKVRVEFFTFFPSRLGPASRGASKLVPKLTFSGIRCHKDIGDTTARQPAISW
jgi:hypothetical protein